jgi:hypothetical protein
VDGDDRGYRVALIADELVNPRTRRIDGLAALEAAGWGAIQLPSGSYPAEVAGPLLEQAAEQAEEFARHGYVLAVVGRHEGLAEALAAYGIAELPAIVPKSAAELRRFLDATGAERRPAQGS